MKRSACGFTLTEVAVFVGVLAISAAIAYPRFVMLEVEARKALVMSLGGSVSSAARQAHFLWILQGRPATIDMDGNTITMLNGYPDKASIDNTLMDYSGFQYRNAVTASFRKIGAMAPDTCMVTYKNALPGASPAVTVFTSGC